MTESICKKFARSELMPALPDKLWLVKNGIVRTSAFTEQGKVTALGYWSTGDVIGLSLNKLDSLQIECITDVEAAPLCVDEWSFYLPAILRHSQHTTQLIIYVMNENVAQRVVNILGWLSDRFGRQIREGVLIDFPITHLAIAELTGATRVTVTRLMGQIVKAGFLAQSQRSRLILLKNLSALDIKSINRQLNQTKGVSTQTKFSQGDRLSKISYSPSVVEGKRLEATPPKPLQPAP